MNNFYYSFWLHYSDHIFCINRFHFLRLSCQGHRAICNQALQNLSYYRPMFQLKSYSGEKTQKNNGLYLKVQKQIHTHMNNWFYDKSNTTEQWQKYSLCNKSYWVNCISLWKKILISLNLYPIHNSIWIIDLNVNQNKTKWNKNKSSKENTGEYLHDVAVELNKVWTKIEQHLTKEA